LNEFLASELLAEETLQSSGYDNASGWYCPGYDGDPYIDGLDVDDCGAVTKSVPTQRGFVPIPVTTNRRQIPRIFIEERERANADAHSEK